MVGCRIPAHANCLGKAVCASIYRIAVGRLLFASGRIRPTLAAPWPMPPAACGVWSHPRFTYLRGGNWS
jgi:hypothetical protein